MSHEIRTPLNGIFGFLELISLTELTDIQKEYIKEAQNSTELLLNLINDILDFSKIEAGKITLEEIEFDLINTVNSVLTISKYKIHDKGLKLNSKIKSNVPKTVIGDPHRLRQVLNNLLSNAVKFTDTGSISINIELYKSHTDYYKLLFEITDTGIGIDENNISNIFTLFSQLDPSSTRKYGGTGLGLSISKSLVNLMGGDINVSSIPGKGSTFYFTSKFKKPDHLINNKITTTDTNTFSADYNDSSNKNNNNFKLLLVEDNLSNQKLVSKFIEMLGYKCDLALNGYEALIMEKQKNYHLIFMDCQMPVMDGYEATKNIRALDNPKIRPIIIALTANAMKGDKEKCLQIGMDDYLSKPVRIDAIEKILKKYL